MKAGMISVQPLSTNKIVIANWKMHGNLEQNDALVKAYIKHLNSVKHTQVIVCVPYPYLFQMQKLLTNSNIAWGAQNMAMYAQGPYTGEVGAEMLLDFGCKYVILGHSERSTAYCESDENIADKFMLAKQSGLTPVLCVGETLIEREAGVMEMVVGKQLDTIVEKYGVNVFNNTIISYEPIWAIGTGLAASPEQAKGMHLFIRNKLNVLGMDASNRLKILYGGSVNPQNALQLFVEPYIDGGLIGRCSLDSQQFVEICEAAEQVTAEALLD